MCNSLSTGEAKVKIKIRIIIKTRSLDSDCPIELFAEFLVISGETAYSNSAYDRVASLKGR
jgi:hypothetical protein